MYSLTRFDCTGKHRKGKTERPQAFTFYSENEYTHTHVHMVNTYVCSMHPKLQTDQRLNQHESIQLRPITRNQAKMYSTTLLVRSYVHTYMYVRSMLSHTLHLYTGARTCVHIYCTYTS